MSNRLKPTMPYKTEDEIKSNWVEIRVLLFLAELRGRPTSVVALNHLRKLRTRLGHLPTGGGNGVSRINRRVERTRAGDARSRWMRRDEWYGLRATTVLPDNLSWAKHWGRNRFDEHSPTTGGRTGKRRSGARDLGIVLWKLATSVQLVYWNLVMVFGVRVLMLLVLILFEAARQRRNGALAMALEDPLPFSLLVKASGLLLERVAHCWCRGNRSRLNRIWMHRPTPRGHYRRTIHAIRSIYPSLEHYPLGVAFTYPLGLDAVRTRRALFSTLYTSLPASCKEGHKSNHSLTILPCYIRCISWVSCKK